MQVYDCGAREDEQQAHFAAWPLHLPLDVCLSLPLNSAYFGA